MRFGWGLTGLLVVLAIVAVAAKKQLASTQQTLPALAQPDASTDGAAPTVREQSQQVQQQVRQQVQTLMQQARPMPENDQ